MDAVQVFHAVMADPHFDITLIEKFLVRGECLPGLMLFLQNAVLAQTLMGGVFLLRRRGICRQTCKQLRSSRHDTRTNVLRLSKVRRIVVQKQHIFRPQLHVRN